MLLLINSNYSDIKKTLKLNCFLAKVWAWRLIKCISTAIFTQLFLELYTHKIYVIHFRLRLTLQKMISSICSAPELSEEFLQRSWNEAYITIRWDQIGASETVAKSVLRFV